MEWLFRRHFWIVHLAFVALVAIVLASVVNLVLELWITQSQTAARSLSPVSIGIGEARNFDVANTRNLFVAKRDIILPGRVGGNCDNWQNAPKSTLGYRLAGTAIFENPRESLAFFEDPRRKGNVVAYSINECVRNNQAMSPELLEILGPSATDSLLPCNKIDSATIKRIVSDPDFGERVYLYNDASRQCEYIAASEQVKALPAQFRKPAAQQITPSSSFGGSVKQTGGSSFEIEGSDLDSILNNLSMLLTQARTVPAFENGKPVGLKFESIQPGSVFEKIGFKKGDVLNKINGYDMSPEKGLELLQKLQTDTQFSVEGKREGQQFNYEYTIKR